MSDDLQHHQRVIQTLSAREISVYHVALNEEVKVESFIPRRNFLLFLEKGEMYLPKERLKIQKGELLVLPEGQVTDLCFICDNCSRSISSEEFNDQILIDSSQEVTNDSSLVFYAIELDVVVYKLFNLFKILELPVFRLVGMSKVSSLIKDLYEEFIDNRIGKREVISVEVLRLLYMMIRVMQEEELFISNFENNNVFFKDDRLIAIFEYVGLHLDKDLSNAALANVANVSEEYVGQYFKHVTGIKLQDFVEKQRMNKALEYLMNTTNSIRLVSSKVGFIDVAYFCRRFKKLYGVSAREMRTSLTLDKYSKVY